MKCKRCGRELKKPENVELGYGPVCKRKVDEHLEAFSKALKTELEKPENKDALNNILGESQSEKTEGAPQ